MPSDDIVSRLRATERAIWDGDDAEKRRAFIKMVADEIERLRAEAWFFRQVAHQYWKDQPDDDNSYGRRLYSLYNDKGVVPRNMEEQTAWLKAVRGE